MASILALERHAAAELTKRAGSTEPSNKQHKLNVPEGGLLHHLFTTEADLKQLTEESNIRILPTKAAAPRPCPKVTDPPASPNVEAEPAVVTQKAARK